MVFGKQSFWLTLLATIVAIAKSQDHSTTSCKKDELSTFVRLRQPLLAFSRDALFPLVLAQGVQTLQECARACAANALFLKDSASASSFSCSGFSYDSSRPTDKCMLSASVMTREVAVTSSFIVDSNDVDELDSPEKPFRIAHTESLDGQSVDGETGFYWKICLRASSDFELAMFPFAFEQTPGRVLHGATEHVLAAKTVQECLQKCIESRKDFHFACRSVMFYYESRQCLLNSLGDFKLLRKESDGFPVDYFEMRDFGYGCGPGTVPQYALLADADIVGGHRLEIRHVTKATCAHFCNINRNDMGEAYSCKAFGYEQDGKVCYLYDEQAYRRGAANVTETKGLMVFEKLCLTASQTCTIIPAFERTPNRVLNGFTHVVLENIPSEEACLSECLRATETHDFECLSTMYYYESRECMLNFDSKVSSGVSEFLSNDTENYTVDYYDNLCAIRKRDEGVSFNACPDRSTPTFFRYNGTEVPQLDVVSYSDMNLPECLKRCNEAENFTCNSVDYRSLDSSCSLSFVDYGTTPLSNVSEGHKTSNYVHYERSCIEGARLVCGADNRVSFDVTFGVRLPADYLILAFSGISLEECLSMCLLDPSNRCRSVNYERESSLCQLNNATGSEADLLDASGDDASVVYYENMCHPGNVVVMAESSNAATSGRQPPRLMGEPDVDASNATNSPKPRGQTTPNMDMQPICEYSDMRVRMVAERAFTGFVFAKNKFGACRVDVEDRAEVVLPLQFPNFQGTESPCGVAEIGHGRYGVIVVVTSNNLGIPGLVTESDRFFNVTCDFTSSFSNLVTATARSVSVNNRKDAPGLYPDGVVVIPSPMNMQLSRQTTPGAQIRTAMLGEELNLDFRYYPGFNRTGMGLFVRQCNASRYSGPPPEPAPLVLIDDGCPSPAARARIVQSAVLETQDGFRLPFTAFRFDGSNSVKISCAIDMCEKGCNPTRCAINGEQVSSHGRKRRRRSFPDRSADVRKKSESGSVVFTVVDKLPPFVTDPRAHQNTSNMLQRLHFIDKEPIRGYIEQFVTYDAVGHKRRVCLKRTAFLGVSAVFSVVCFAQVVVIAAYVAHQYVTQSGKKCE